jgi:hypothetical protein
LVVGNPAAAVTVVSVAIPSSSGPRVAPIAPIAAAIRSSPAAAVTVVRVATPSSPGARVAAIARIAPAYAILIAAILSATIRIVAIRSSPGARVADIASRWRCQPMLMQYVEIR